MAREKSNGKSDRQWIKWLDRCNYLGKKSLEVLIFSLLYLFVQLNLKKIKSNSG